MVQSALTSLALGYRPLWNADRKLAGVQLFMHEDGGEQPDVPHFLRMLQEMWSPTAPQLILSPQQRHLLVLLLEHTPQNPYLLVEVRGEWLADSALYTLVQRAQARGVRLVWRGALDALPDADSARWFSSSMLHLAPQDAVQLMQLHPDAPLPPHLALLDGQMYEDLHSRAIMHRCLDQHRAAAIVGWPSEDVQHKLRGERALAPSHEHVMRLLKAVDADESLDSFEQILSEDPMLAYRFLMFTNSASLALRSGVDSLRMGFVMLGYSHLKQWLAGQLTQASADKDLQPIRASTVMRAELTERLLDPGVSQELRSEVYLCGLFSRLDELLDEPLSQTLQRLPLSERIHEAAVDEDGPYAPSLLLAQALEREEGAVVRELCERFKIDMEHVNRTLLRSIVEWPCEKLVL
ncbi:HDOD domain-containing protein [Comamonas sp. GB3 AK4-5]|uniref:HDOD domain-containing protein n=1 Tax=Comamonas sp. GB3 AK4-5 TaxID=3231487 RepID=UPI00351EAD77